jgi:Xaa-Pro aminopeptidase
VTDSPETTDQPLSARGGNRSLRPTSRRFLEFVTSGWAARPDLGVTRAPAADAAAARRARLSAQFPGQRLVVPAGTAKVRSNDTDFRFRPHAAFAHLTGLGMEQEPEAVLVLHPTDDGSGHRAVLYLRPPAGRDTEEFFADSAHGEFWVGARPALEDVATLTGINTAHLDGLRDALAKDVGADGVRLVLVADVDRAVDEVVAQIRADEAAGRSDERLAEALSELRLVKDAHELEQLQSAVDITIEGFEKVVRALPEALTHRRGERVVEGTFLGHARQAGNDVGYHTIAAAGEHATTLHWTDNDGPVRDGDLLLLDAGVEADSLYTADVTRTIPVDGTYTEAQRRVYQAVLDAADAAIAVIRPGIRFRDVHAAAMEVIADRVAAWGLLPVDASESLDPDVQLHRRWMVHGTSHHLGLDVHDCAQARAEMYLDGVLEPGMVFTVEPGLYFKSDDLLVPAELRGIGVRIEDDVVVTDDGCRLLTAALPRTPDDVEAWMASLRRA